MTNYWHFAAINKNGKPVMRDGTLIEVGKRYEIDGEPVLCEYGYHGSILAIDALKYAPGAWISQRPLEGVIEGDDKVVGNAFVQQQGADATEVLHEFARLCALDVVRLWDAPQIVVDYLKTGDDSLRDEACGAAMSAAWGAEMGAARSAACYAVCCAERSVACGASRYVAWDLELDASSDDAKAKARENQNKRLEKMLLELLKKKEGLQ